MTEARYRGQKVVVVSPDYADNVKFADEWLAAAPGTDGALAMAMGHVILKEFFVDRQTPYFTDYVKKYTDLPFLVAPDERRDAATATYRAGKFLTAADLPEHADEENAALQDRPARRAHRRAGGAERLARATASATPGVGQLEPRPRRRRPAADPARAGAARRVSVELPRFDDVDGDAGLAAARRAGAPGRRPPGHHGLRPDARPVRRGPRRACRATGQRRTTTRPRRTPRPGRSRSPASRPPRPPGSPGSSRRTPRSPRAAR